MEHPLTNPKYAQPEPDRLVQLTREAVVARIQANLDGLGDRTWAEVLSTTPGAILSADDVTDLAESIFEAFSSEHGRRYYAGCEIAALQHPRRYMLRSEDRVLVDGSELPPDAIGDGDNVFLAEDVTGTVLLIDEVSEVERLIEDGVPEGAIGVIDDAGGTMSAPILADFDAVLCLAGSVRSHLAIIAREFAVPTLMGVRLSEPLTSGDIITVQYSVAAQDTDALFSEDLQPRAVIRRAGAAR